VSGPTPQPKIRGKVVVPRTVDGSSRTVDGGLDGRWLMANHGTRRGTSAHLPAGIQEPRGQSSAQSRGEGLIDG
jgi:hypothetical protein